MKEQLALACECGATMKVSAPARQYGDEQLKDAQEYWDREHEGPGHGSVSLAEARDIREQLNRPIRRGRG